MAPVPAHVTLVPVTVKTKVQNRALNQNFGPTTFFVLQRRVHTEKMRTLSEKLKEKFYF